MAALRSQAIRHLSRSPKFRDISSPFGSSRTYSNPGFSCRTLTYSFKSSRHFQWYVGVEKPLHASMVTELSLFLHDKRSMSTKVKAPPQIRQMGALKVSMVSPGIVYEPYAPREPISFLRRWFTRSGWRRTKEDFMMELKTAYAIAKLRKVSGYSKNKFYEEAVQLYKEINIFIANGDKASLRKAVTENMYSALKNEIKQRESKWSSVYWELIVPIVKMRTLRARMISIDKNDLNKAFIQLTIEFLAKQKFEAYDSKGNVVAGDKSKEVLVRDIWTAYLSGHAILETPYSFSLRKLVLNRETSILILS
ncbi:Tim44-like domain-containing protein [Cinnamomum micranthum f. kanehirae]|uniref:Large ribosomal subunit protein mL45 n=1 Tax=Cinnamomum micranthum f. kanehirae TaxID=337451 RepID=A0A3S3N0U7_9MAGN|nr:Tim44-like domain-containing protein [Cinnamomum micranthum f. kanehirae]